MNLQHPLYLVEVLGLDLALTTILLRIMIWKAMFACTSEIV